MSNPVLGKTAYKAFFQLFCLAVAGFLVNFILAEQYVSDAELHQLYYSLPQLYAIFGFVSFIILLLLLIISKKSFDNVGYAFLGITSVKMGLAYFLLKPVLAIGTTGFSFGKANFFIVFIYFLVIETTITIRILNNKQ